MKKILFTLAILLIIIGGIRFAQGYTAGEKISFLKGAPTIVIANHNFKVTVADSQKEQEIGLSKTKSLTENQGMIFLFQKPDYYSFWMKNMGFPIDIIFINNDTIVSIENNAQAPKSNNENLIVYTPTSPSDKVLEIQAGLAKKYNFKNGDKIKIEGI
jgi:uncharacterized protein